jgi:hypothetical protein
VEGAHRFAWCAKKIGQGQLSMIMLACSTSRKRLNASAYGNKVAELQNRALEVTQSRGLKGFLRNHLTIGCGKWLWNTYRGDAPVLVR